MGAHPRACGENTIGTLKSPSGRGSSPRMRGKPQSRDPMCSPSRLIPAHAGKTRERPKALNRRTAHPRACGENVAGVSFGSFGAGSSPRMRGKRNGLVNVLCCQGLIPAHAGKTSQSLYPVDRAWAHPRACGENASLCQPTARPRGSSPRMRGKRRDDDHDSPARGLIPAHAGKTRRNELRWG